VSRHTPTNVVGGVYNSVAPVFTEGQFVALQFDVNGNLLTTGGGGGGGNASVSLVGNPVPTSATAIGMEDVSGNLQFVSATNPLPITGSISATNPSVGVIGSAIPSDATLLGVKDGSGNLQAVSAAFPVRVDPTGTTTQPVSFLSLPAGSNLIGQVEVSDGTNILFTSGHPGFVAQGTAAALTAGWPGVGGLLAPVPATWTSSTTTNTAITLSNTQGYATALLTLAQTNSMNLFTVVGEGFDGTNWLPIQTVTDASATNILGVIVLGASTTSHFYQFNIVGFQQFRIRVTATTIGSGQAVFALSAQATPIAGIVTVSGIQGSVTLNALPAGTNVIGHVFTDSGSTTAVTQATAANLNATVVGTGTLAVQNTAATPAGTNLIGQVSASDETSTLYNGTTALTPSFAVITASSSGVTNLVALVSSKKIRVLSLVLTANGAVNVKFQSHATPTDITGLFYLSSTGGFVLPYNPTGWFQTLSGEALDINLSGSIAVGGCLEYVAV